MSKVQKAKQRSRLTPSKLEAIEKEFAVDNSKKSCPVCRNEVKRRSGNNCPHCGVTLYLADGEYFLIDSPIERLIIHTLGKFIAGLKGIDVLSEKDIKKYMPSLADISVMVLKNEAHAAKKLLGYCGGDFELAVETINTYYKLSNLNSGQAFIRYIVAHPNIKAFVYKARQDLHESKVLEALKEDATQTILNRMNSFGSIYKSEREDLPSE